MGNFCWFWILCRVLVQVIEQIQSFLFNFCQVSRKMATLNKQNQNPQPFLHKHKQVDWNLEEKLQLNHQPLLNKDIPQTTETIQQNQQMIPKRLSTILSKIDNVKNKYNIKHHVQLIAVSKTKSVEQIKEAYNAGQRHFGQNYVDQIEEKCPKLPEDIKWHFIGHLQSNKIKKLLVPGLYMLQTVDRQSLAEKLQKALEKEERKLNILIQVKTSEQESKNGCPSAELEKLYEFIDKQCPNLVFRGLMTIGKEGDTKVFEHMFDLRKQLVQKYKLNQDEFELSMGMSNDFQVAIQNYSTMVRVGSAIFGPRDYPNKHKAQETGPKDQN